MRGRDVGSQKTGRGEKFRMNLHQLRLTSPSQWARLNWMYERRT
jgi:hypothetical protein